MTEKEQKEEKEQFTKYEIARILGARALQLAMGAPILLKISKDELGELKYDNIKIAEKEFYAAVLPITVKRPLPKKKEKKLEAIEKEKEEKKKAEEKVEDKEIEKKEEIEEKEIKEEGEIMEIAKPGDEAEEEVVEEEEGIE